MEIKFNFFGTEMDVQKEHELISKIFYPFGFTVFIEYKDGKIQKLNNCTEIHWKFPSPIIGSQTAFESDHHSTGCTKFLDRIKEVTVIEALYKAEKY